MTRQRTNPRVPAAAWRRKRNGRRGLVLSAGLSVISLMTSGELAVRAYDAIHGVNVHTHNAQEALQIPHPYVNWTWKPDSVARVDLRHPKVYRYNAAGLRGRPFEPVKPAEVFRVICLGESSTWGGYYLSSEEASWPAQLERELAARHPDRRIEVINAGLPGWTTYENLANLVTRLINYEPDVLIVYEMVNDLGLVGILTPARDVGELRRHLLAPAWHRWLCHSALYSVLTHRVADWLKLEREGLTEAMFEERWVPFGLRAFERNLSLMVQVARYEDVPIMLSTQAIRPELLEDYQRPQEAPMQDLIRAVAGRSGVPLVDNARLIPHELLADYVHLTDEAAVQLARNFADEIGRRGYLRHTN
ncbi:MAG: hypothetical protein HYY91_00615 [Candidatus Omnitrophica bacterium]|nr:hypothetical protein [Candidatus Omnitrophota bacterium]